MGEVTNLKVVFTLKSKVNLNWGESRGERDPASTRDYEPRTQCFFVKAMLPS